MPSFEVDFEVFCGTCGAGLCNQSDTRQSRFRRENQLTVNACEPCINSATQPLIDRISELENLLEDLQQTK